MKVSNTKAKIWNKYAILIMRSAADDVSPTRNTLAKYNTLNSTQLFPAPYFQAAFNAP